MAITQMPVRLLDEVADFLATGPSAESLLHFRPSQQSQERAQELIERQGEGTISYDEQRELDQFELTERLMRLIKAKLHAKKAMRS